MIGDEGRGDQLYLSLCRISTGGTRLPTEQGRARRPHAQRQDPSRLGERLLRQPPTQTATCPHTLAAFIEHLLCAGSAPGHRITKGKRCTHQHGSSGTSLVGLWARSGVSGPLQVSAGAC